MIAVTVAFTLAPGTASAFRALVEENAATSLRDEPGCLQFDVCTDAARPDEIFLYERYTDRAAFDEHLASSHYRAFDAATRDLVVEKRPTTYADVRFGLADRAAR